MEKKPGKKPILKREVLWNLSREEARKVGGGEFTYTCDSCACVW